MGTADEKYEAYTHSLEAALKRLTNAWEEFTQKVEASWIVKSGIGFLTGLIEHMDILTAALGVFLGRFAAAKAPAWLGSFFSNNIGGGKGRTFLRKLVGGNQGFIGSRKNDKILASYDSEIGLWKSEVNQLNDKFKKGQIEAEVYNARGKDLAARGKELAENKPKLWAEDADKTRGLGKTNSLLEQILQWIRTHRGNGAADKVEQQMAEATQQHTAAINADTKAVAENAKMETEEVKANVNSAQTEVAEANSSMASAEADAAETSASLAAAESDVTEARSGVASAQGNAGGTGIMSKLTSAKGSQALGAVGSGVMSGLMSASMTNTIGDSGVSGWLNKTDQTVEADTADKVIKGGLAGGLAAVGTYFLGPLGGMLGNIIGGGIADLISYFRHKDELERKQRVAEAQERLVVLQKMTGIFENFTDVVHKDILEADDYTELYNIINELKTLFVDDRKGEQEFVEAVFAGVGDQLEGYPHSLQGIEKALTGTNMALREAVSNMIQAQLLKQERDTYFASQEQAIYDTTSVQQEFSGKTSVALGGYDYSRKETSPGSGEYEIESTWNSWSNDDLDKFLRDLSNRGVIDLSDVQVDKQNRGGNLGTAVLSRDYEIHGTTLQEQAKNAEILKTELRGVVGEESALYSKASETADELAKQANIVEQIYQKMREYDVQIGITASNIRNLTEDEKKAYGVEGVYYLVAEAMEAQGIAVRGVSGLIKQEYLPVIEKALRQEGSLTKLLKGETKTYGDLTKARNKFTEAVNATLFDKNTWQELNNLLKRGELDEIRKAYKDTFGEMADQDIISIITGSDPAKLQDLAYALGLTTEQMEALGPALENVSVSLALEGAEAIRTLKDEYAGLWKELSRGALSMESLEKVLEKIPELAPKLKNTADFKQFLLDSILGENSTYEKLYQKQIFKEYTRNEAVFRPFKETFDARIKAALSNDETLTKAWKNAETFEDAWDVLHSEAVEGFEGGKLAQEIAEQFNFKLEYKDPFKEAFLDAYLEEAKYLLDEQLKNLNAQKEALSAINDERKKELELMKAKEALENAKKEKKMVYREGVGFVYEADEEAISSARDELDTLETQKQQDNLQLEIDRLELEKEILEYLPTMEERAALKDVYDSVNEKLASLNGSYLPGNTEALNSLKTEVTSLATALSPATLAQQVLDYLKKKENDPDPENDSENNSNGGSTSGVIDMGEQYDEYEGAHKQNQDTNVSNLITLIKNYQDSQKWYDNAKDAFEGAPAGQNIGQYTELREAQEFRNADLLAIQQAFEPLKTMSDDALKAAFMAVDKEKGEKYFNELTSKRGGILRQNQETMDGYLVNWRIGEAMTVSGGEAQPSGHGMKYTDFKQGENVLGSDFLDSEFYKHPNDSKLYKYSNEGGIPHWEENGVDFKTPNDVKWEDLNDYDVVGNHYGEPDVFVIKIGNGVYRLKPIDSYATGTYDLNTADSSYQRINELGTEGIITPQGTFTALPSHTGIVPADITKNLWRLGEVAPQLIAQLGSLKKSSSASNRSGDTYNDTTNISEVNVYPTKDYDMDKLLAEAKAKARITRHNN